MQVSRGDPYDTVYAIVASLGDTGRHGRYEVTAAQERRRGGLWERLPALKANEYL